MPKPPDRVQLHKQESAAGGGNPADDDELLQTALDPAEDAPDVAGVYFQEDVGGGVSSEDKQVTLYREDGKLYAEDVDNAGAGRKCLSEWAPTPEQVGQVRFAASADAFTNRVPIIGPQGWLTSGGKLMVK